jgi:Cu-processing system permease protein
VQVTLATTAEILFGKFLAAWVTGLAFVAVSVPFLVLANLAGGGAPATITVSLLVLVFEVGVIAAIGVALSGILSRPLFSVATTYLVVAALVVGTLIAFALVGFTMRSEVTNHYRAIEYENYTGDTFPCMPGEEPSDEYPCDPDVEVRCGPWQTSTHEVPRFDYVWWLLAANPFVILAIRTTSSGRSSSACATRSRRRNSNSAGTIARHDPWKTDRKPRTSSTGPRPAGSSAWRCSWCSRPA